MYSVVPAEQKNSRPECIDAVRELQFREQIKALSMKLKGRNQKGPFFFQGE